MKHYWPIAVSKFVDHLPEHRIQQMLKREQVAIPPSTMNTWTQKMAELFKLVAMQIRKEILAGKYIQMDETTIKVLFVKKDKTHQGYMWVVVDPRTKNTYFEYRRVKQSRPSTYAKRLPRKSTK